MPDARVSPLLRRELLPHGILVFSLSLTLLATIIVADVTRERDLARFENNVQAATDRISSRLSTYVTTLLGGTALFAASDSVSLNEWRAYVDRLDTRGNYPGIQGIGFTRRLSPEQVPLVEAKMRNEGFPGFSVTPTRPRDEYHTIVYLEPLDIRNRAALGYDMFTDATRREAMERARDTGRAAMSGRVVLVQEIDENQQAGFLIYVPVYEGGEIPGTEAERRRLLRGFVYSPFRSGDLFAGVFGTEARPRVSFQVFDGVGVAPDRLLYRTPSYPDGEPSLTETVRLNIAGRDWTLAFAPAEGFRVASSDYLPPLIGLAGALTSLLLFLFLRAQARARSAAEANRIQAEDLAAQLHDRAAEAEEANRAKSQFLTNMSHELRTPLNAIAGYVDLLELGIPGPVNEAQLSYLEKIKRAENHLLRQINDVLNFAKIEAGRLEYRIHSVSVEQTLAELDAIVVPLAHKKNIRYHRERGAPEITVCADPEKLQQIVVNLLSNAVKFTPPDGEIRATWAREGSEIAIRITDTGRGIPADRLESIFDPFIQVEADLTRTSEGTGLGLAISRQLATGMGGSLTASSEPGVGSVFELRVPIGDEPGSAS